MPVEQTMNMRYKTKGRNASERLFFGILASNL
jgi:hypothetical protein